MLGLVSGLISSGFTRENFRKYMDKFEVIHEFLESFKERFIKEEILMIKVIA